MVPPCAVFTFSSSRPYRRDLRSRCEDSNGTMGDLRRWTTSPYLGRQALSRGDYDYLEYNNPFYDLGRMMRGYLAAPPPHAVRFLYYRTLWRSSRSSRAYHCSVCQGCGVR